MNIFMWIVECGLNLCRNKRQIEKVRTEIPVDRVLKALSELTPQDMQTLLGMGYPSAKESVVVGEIEDI